MKKYSLIVFILILSLGLLAGCRNQNNNNDTVPSTSMPITTPTTAATNPATADTGTDGMLGECTDATGDGLIPGITEGADTSESTGIAGENGSNGSNGGAAGNSGTNGGNA